MTELFQRAEALDSKTPHSEAIPATASHQAAKGPQASRNLYSLLFPSFSDLVFIVLLVVLSCGAMGSRLLNDAGIGWHIRNGEHILSTHTFTRADFFSSTMSGRPWYAWEWLYDVLIAGIHSLMGLNGVVFFTALVIALTLALVSRYLLRRGASLPIVAFMLVLTVGASMIHVTARPHVLSWLLAVVFYTLLDSSQSAQFERRRLLLWLPLLMLFWVNLHGGFLLGFALVGITLAGRLLENLLHREAFASAKTQLVPSLALVVLASFINPYGYKLYLHIWAYLSNSFLMTHISEFMSPDFHNLPARCFSVLVLIAICTLSLSREKLSASKILLLLFAIYTGLLASRNLPVSSILLTMIVAPLLSKDLAAAENRLAARTRPHALLTRWNAFSARMGRVDSGFGGHIWSALVVLLGLGVCAHGGRLGPYEIVNAHFDQTRFPVQAVAVIANQKFQGPILCPDLWGGYLIYTLYPQTKVVLDDRHDLYGEEFFKDYLKVTRVESGWETILNKWGSRYVLVPTNSPLASALREKTNWTILHEDSTAVLLYK